MLVVAEISHGLLQLATLSLCARLIDRFAHRSFDPGSGSFLVFEPVALILNPLLLEFDVSGFRIKRLGCVTQILAGMIEIQRLNLCVFFKEWPVKKGENPGLL